MLLCSFGNFGPKPPFLPYFNILQNTSSEKYFCILLQLQISHRISFALAETAIVSLSILQGDGFKILLLAVYIRPLFFSRGPKCL